MYKAIGLAAALTGACCALLAACGGGGGGSSGSGTAVNPPVPSLTISQTTAAVAADTSGAAPASLIIQATIANAPATGLQARVGWSGAAVANVSFTSQSAGSGQLIVAFTSPASLGAGTYAAAISLQVCTDSACAHPISGSPASVSVTYTVTGAPPPTPSFSFSQPISSFQATTSETGPQTANISFTIANVPAAGLYIRITQPTGGFVTAITDTQQEDSAGNIDVDFVLTLISPASLGSGYFNSSITFMVCYDQACTQQLAGSPVIRPIYYTVDLTQGLEYTLVQVSQGGISDLAYDSANQQLYASGLAGYSSTFSSAISQVDPLTGQVGQQPSLSDGLSGVAVSDDGQYLYAGSTHNPVIHRLLLPALQADLDIPLGSTPNSGGSSVPNLAGQMAVAPGAAATIAVSLAQPSSNSTAGTQIFDDAIPRAQSLLPLGPNASPDSITWGSTAGLLFAYRYSFQLPFDQEFDTVLVNAAGLSVQSVFDVTGGADSVGQIFFAGGNLYDLGGYVRDANSGVMVGQFQMPQIPADATPNQNQIVAMVPDIAHGRAFFLVHNTQSSHLLLFSFDLSSLLLQSVIDLGFDNFDVALSTHMVLWGTDGVAFNRNGLQILAGSFYLAPSATAIPRLSRSVRVVAARRAHQ